MVKGSKDVAAAQVGNIGLAAMLSEKGLEAQILHSSGLEERMMISMKYRTILVISQWKTLELLSVFVHRWYVTSRVTTRISIK